MNDDEMDDRYDGWDDDDGDCPECGGTGWINDCCDDMCQGQGWCMHGDGDRPCPECNEDLRDIAPPDAPSHWRWKSRRAK